MTREEELEAEVARWKRAALYRQELAGIEVTVDEVRYTLGRVGDDDATWLAMMKVMQQQFDIEETMALGREKEMREYNAGRAAAVADMISLLAQIREAGRR